MNNRCPYCNAELIASIVVSWKGVPLAPDGFVPSDGDLIGTEIVSVACRKCNWEGPGDYYHTTPQAEIDVDALPALDDVEEGQGAEVARMIEGAFYVDPSDWGALSLMEVEAQPQGPGLVTQVPVSPVGDRGSGWPRDVRALIPLVKQFAEARRMKEGD